MVSNKNLALFVACFTLIFVGSVAAQGIRFPGQDPPGPGSPDPTSRNLGSVLAESGTDPESPDQLPAEDAPANRLAIGFIIFLSLPIINQSVLIPNTSDSSS